MGIAAVVLKNLLSFPIYSAYCYEVLCFVRDLHPFTSIQDDGHYLQVVKLLSFPVV